MAVADAPTDWLLVIGGVVLVPIVAAIALLVWFLLRKFKR